MEKARLVEERFEERRLLKIKEAQRAKLVDASSFSSSSSSSSSTSAPATTLNPTNTTTAIPAKVAFVSKKRRLELASLQAAAEAKERDDLIAKQKADERRREKEEKAASRARSQRPRAGNQVPVNAGLSGWTRPSAPSTSSSSSTLSTSSSLSSPTLTSASLSTTDPNPNQNQPYLNQSQLLSLRHHYLGLTSTELSESQMTHRLKYKQAKKTQFKFQWGDDEDTARDVNPIYDVSCHKVGKVFERDVLFDEKNRVNESGVNVYTKPLLDMNSRDWRIVRENHNIKSIVEVMKYTSPSPIQRQAIPIGLQFRDLIGIAETGSGKTAAFGIPMIHHILSFSSTVLNSVGEKGPLAIVLAPTRELALQIDDEIKKLLSLQEDVKTLAVVGGQDMETQAYKLRNGIHIVIGTPGRMDDCIDNCYLVLNQCNYIVLDEADRMLDMGFEPQLNSILENMGGLLKSEDEGEAYEQELKDITETTSSVGESGIMVVPKHRITSMFSATMPIEVERLAKTFLRHPAIISIGEVGSNKNLRIEQRVIWLNKPELKERNLMEILSKRLKGEKIIVFVNEKKTADRVGQILQRSGVMNVVLHGGKAQDVREDNLRTFKLGGCVLVATDVAGRGLDVPDVAHVINYDLPAKSIDSYCHRIGRTGRAGKEGIATSFLTGKDEEIMKPLLKYLKETGARIPEQLSRGVERERGVE